MTTTLSGENSYALLTKLHDLIAEFVNDYGDLAVERLDGEETSIDQIQAALTSLPFLTPKKLVVLRAPNKQKLFVERAEQLLAALPETTDVVIVEPKLDKRTAYYKYLHTKTIFCNFSELDEPTMVRWLIQQAESRGGNLSSADARYLIMRVGLNQQLLASEIEKLLLYSPNISRQTVELLTETTPQSTIFQLLEAAFAGRQAQALQLYAEQRAQKVEPQQIIALLSWQLHILAIVKASANRSTETIAKEAKLSPYVVQKSQAIARKLTIADLKNQISALLSIDIHSKRSNLDLDDALRLYLLTLAI